MLFAGTLILLGVACWSNLGSIRDDMTFWRGVAFLSLLVIGIGVLLFGAWLIGWPWGIAVVIGIFVLCMAIIDGFGGL